jgi:diacylglycerol kinase
MYPHTHRDRCFNIYISSTEYSFKGINNTNKKMLFKLRVHLTSLIVAAYSHEDVSEIVN